MRRESKYDESSAIRDLQNAGVHFKYAPRKIADRSNAQLGIKLLGKFDFLVNYCGFAEIYTPQHSFINRGFRHYSRTF